MIIRLYEVFDCKPVLIKAFNAAKNLNAKKVGGVKNKHGPDFIEMNEFRMLLWYVRFYFELWQMFDEIDTGDDRRIDLKEFTAAVPRMAEWGVNVTDPVSEFLKIDTNHGGQILFDEFIEWATSHHLDLDDDDDLA